ncbi:MAG TPA: YbjN domain-containing protein [Steroidobacteraceae bacterium]|nr:YbjN domain-containing protein [Steroidobacteraceae bacterium]
MIKQLLNAIAVALVLIAPAFADAAKVDLSKVVLSDDDKVATSQLLEWLQARSFDASMVSNVLVYRTKGVPLNITALQGSGELDRIVFLSYYSPTPEAKGKPEFVELARKLNSSQNFMQVKVDEDGDLAITASLTYVDEISAREFDYFVDLFTAVMSRYILTDEALKMLQ